MEGKQTRDLDLNEVYVTVEERENKSPIKNLIKAYILKKKNKEKLDLLPDCDGNIQASFVERFDKAKKRIDSTSKPTIKALYYEVKRENIKSEFLGE